LCVFHESLGCTFWKKRNIMKSESKRRINPKDEGEN